MKRFTLLALLCLFAIQGISSQELSYEDQLAPEEAEQYYQNRFKKKRGTARGFLFSGIGLIGIGYLVADSEDVLAGAGVIGIGAVSSIVSIPFYIKANSFKKKSKEAREQMNVTLGTIHSPNRKDLAIGLSYSF